MDANHLCLEAREKAARAKAVKRNRFPKILNVPRRRGTHARKEARRRQYVRVRTYGGYHPASDNPYDNVRHPPGRLYLRTHHINLGSKSTIENCISGGLSAWLATKVRLGCCWIG